MSVEEERKLQTTQSILFFLPSQEIRKEVLILENLENVEPCPHFLNGSNGPWKSLGKQKQVMGYSKTLPINGL